MNKLFVKEEPKPNSVNDASNYNIKEIDNIDPGDICNSNKICIQANINDVEFNIKEEIGIKEEPIQIPDVTLVVKESIGMYQEPIYIKNEAQTSDKVFLKTNSLQKHPMRKIRAMTHKKSTGASGARRRYRYLRKSAAKARAARAANLAKPVNAVYDDSTVEVTVAPTDLLTKLSSTADGDAP